MKAKIWYLYNSGFAVKTDKHFLIFDYWKQRTRGKELDNGFVDPETLIGQDVVAFVSHSHGDHYSRALLDWGRIIPNYRLVLSDDIPKAPGALMIGPGMNLQQDDFKVETLASNDEGVAFVVDVDGMCIYHAGDLNWWHWEGEPDDYNEGMASSYKSQIDLLRGRSIDLAFVPVDPRLGEQYAWGIGYLMETADVRHVVPMHFGNDEYVVDWLLKDEVSTKYRERIKRLVKRGDSVEIND